MPTSLAEWIVAGALIVAGIVHLLPLPGVLGGARLRALYGVPADDAGLVLLLRHRAVLFGLLGAYLIHAAFAPQHQPLAFVAGLVSLLSFLALARNGGARGVAMRRVVYADLVALTSLLAALPFA